MVTKLKDLASVHVYNSSTEIGNVAGTKNDKKFIAVHQTGNFQRGAGAKSHAKLQKDGYGINRNVSWHYQVDDTYIIQSFEHNIQCFHASDGFTVGGGNLSSISFEMCVNPDSDYNKAFDNLVIAIVDVMKVEFKGKRAEDVLRQHYDFDKKNRKNCPQQIREGKNGLPWQVLLNRVNAQLDGAMTTTPTVSGAKVHKVVKGDTLWGISKQYGVTVANLKAWNSLKSDLIVPCLVLNLQATASTPVAKPVAKKTYVQLAAHEPTWRAYRLGTKPVVGNEVGFLAPRQYGGLEYQILGYEDNGTCAIIQTQAFGRVKIFIKDPSAKIVTK